MKSIVLLLLCSFSTTLVAQQITVLEDKASIQFLFEDQDVDGEISGFIFTGVISLSDLEHATISGSVATETLDTDNWLRNRHLRGKKYFYAKQYPQLLFTSRSVVATSKGFDVFGTLTIKGTTRDIQWAFRNEGTHLKGTTSINTQDYGISVYDDRHRNTVSISITLPYTTD